ncbi:diaminopropionate ammonia-lyase [Salinicoccus sp. HZC-1]|uniref:diaminopropionate ammonia-lyase n=1 Tax=Salinicoccus sp. HZC-1 TaxID=3385497 RepID=UPI00398B3B42
MQSIQWVENRFKTEKDITEYMKVYSAEEMEKANHFHASMPQYKETPLRVLSGLSEALGLDTVYVKDESKRFDLNAFKGLGASYAMANYFAKELNVDLNTLTFNELLDKIADLPKVTFATATDGNHGKGVAWAASIFNQDSRIYMPKGTAQSRLDAVSDFDAGGQVTEMNYDDTVEYTADLSEKNGWILLQDTAWEGYEEIPMNIMQGYTTIIAEIMKQLEDGELDEISHIFLQAGVGSFAGAIAAAVHNATEGIMPEIIVVEPAEADCLCQSAQGESGAPVRVNGELDSMMAGLCCGEPSPQAWNILKSITDYFVSCDDSISARGMRVFDQPAGKDERVVSGESGAVTLGLLDEIMTNEAYGEFKNLLGLNEASKVLIINTEGDTDPVNYKKIVRDGNDEYE